jgi:hypothetical protein
MPTPTYVAIAKTVLTTTNTTITFSSIPSTYTDLLLVFSSAVTSTGSTGAYLMFNNEGTGSTLGSSRVLEGRGSSGVTNSAGSGSVNYIDRCNVLNSTTVFSNCEIYIPNYAGSTNKPINITTAVEGNSAGTDVYIDAQASLWRNTAAINRIDLQTSAGSFQANSSFYLYGIKNS